MSDGVWSAEGTSPAEIEAALRELQREPRAEDEMHAPARVLNLVVVVERERVQSILESLERVGRLHPSRTVVCGVEPGRTRLDAWATMACDVGGRGRLAVCRERVELEIGPRHLAHLATIVEPILVRELPTVVWSPYRGADALGPLRDLAQVMLLDSVCEPAEVNDALARAAEIVETTHVVDLSWIRGAPWRERVAALFDPPSRRAELDRIASVRVRHRRDSTVAGLLVVAWLCSRLGWESRPLERSNGSLSGSAGTGSGDVEVTLDTAGEAAVPGLVGVALSMADGSSISLDRGPGGLAAREEHGSATRSWRMLGASRGEGGILGEAMRQTLLRDPVYRPALANATAMAP